MALRVLLQGLRCGEEDGEPHRRRASGARPAGRAPRAVGSGRRGQQPAVHRGAERPAGHGDVHRRRRIRRGGDRRTGRARPARLRPRRANPRTTSSRTASSPTTRSTASAEPTSATSSTSRTTIPTRTSSGSSRTTAPRRRSSAPPTPSSPTTAGARSKSLWTEIGEGDPIKVRELADEHAEARYVVAEVERLVDEGVSRAEIAVFYRTNAQSRVLEDMLVRAQIGYQVIGGTKFYERAEIKDAIAYLTFLVNPADGGAFTRIANSPQARASGRRRCRACSRTPTRWGSRRGRPRSGPTGCRCSAPPRRRRSAASCRPWSGCASGRPATRRSASCSRRRCARRATSTRWQAERTIEAQGRIENLEELVRVAREYDATPRRTRARGARGVPAADRAALGRGRAPRRRGARDADDAPQRQGARVPDRLHHRLRGRRLPALPGARRGRRGGGAPARLRRHHARHARPHDHVRAAPQRVRRRTPSACARASSTRSRAS